MTLIVHMIIAWVGLAFSVSLGLAYGPAAFWVCWALTIAAVVVVGFSLPLLWRLMCAW